jgi:hypothetical protein
MAYIIVPKMASYHSKACIWQAQKFGSPPSILKNGMEKLFGSTLVVSFVQSLFQLFLVYTLYLTSNVQDTII